MDKIDLIIDALENCKGLTQIDRAHLKKALAAARELRDAESKKAQWGNPKHLIEEAVLAEREACAKLCESMGVHPALNVYNGGPEWYQRQKECAAAIRARGEK